MRLWTIHPKYLDRQGLVAVWREGLLARAVLRGKTKGYRYHPQLRRFQECGAPCGAINAFLAAVFREATDRGYSFDLQKIGPVRRPHRLLTTTGQLQYEWEHLLKKLSVRSRSHYERWREIEAPLAHPLFQVVEGPLEPWERVSPLSLQAPGGSPEAGFTIPSPR